MPDNAKNTTESLFSSKRSVLRKAGTVALAGTLAFATVPAPALAEAAAQAAPSGQQDGTPPAPPNGEAPKGDAPGGGPGGPGAPGGGPGGADTQTFDYGGGYSASLAADGTSESTTDQNLSATDSSSNVVLAQNGGTLTVNGGTLEKSGSNTDGDACNFYGINSIALAVGDSSKISLQNALLNATSEGSNGIFATDGATVFANNFTINTTAGNSRGLDATYGGTIVANGATISTQGEHCAAVATDRGGGNISLANASLSTAGSGSPLVYSTGNIQVSKTSGTAAGSQLVGMEGLNTVLIDDSTLESTQTGATASDPIADGVIIYQSTSGDAEAKTGETASFQASNSKLKSAITSGAMFYLTNTSADIVLAGTTLDFDSNAAALLVASGNNSNNWGTSGSNGATAKLTGIGQTLSGNIEADAISSVDVHLTKNSTWTGTAANYAGAGATTGDTSTVSVSVDDSSSWIVTGNTTVANLTVANGDRVRDADGNNVKIVDASGNTLAKGSSDVTVTVEGAYSTSYDASSASTLATSLIDRSSFDSEFGTSTAFSMGANAASDGNTSSTDTEKSATDNGGSSWWDGIVSFFKGLFGMS